MKIGDHIVLLDLIELLKKQEYSIKHLNRICISFEHVVNSLIHMKIEILQIKTAEAKESIIRY